MANAAPGGDQSRASHASIGWQCATAAAEGRAQGLEIQPLLKSKDSLKALHADMAHSAPTSSTPT